MSLLVTIDGVRIEHSSCSYTSSDPGGCESAQIKAVSSLPPRPGARVVISDGGAPVWVGRVEEPGHREGDSVNIGCVGAKVELSDRRMAMIYRSADLSLWQGFSTQRLLNAAAGVYSPMNGPTTMTDDETGNPSLKMEVSGEMQGSNGGFCEAYFDAGEHCVIGRVQWTGVSFQNIDGTWASHLYSADDDVQTDFFQEFNDIFTNGQTVIDDEITKKRRWVFFSLHYPNTYTATADTRYMLIKNLAVVGDHGIPLRVLDDGKRALRVSDILADVIRRSGIASDLLIQDCTVMVQDLAYRTLVSHQQIIDDLLRLTGWHFGVWPASTLLEDRPQIIFQSPPPQPTAVVRYGDLMNPDITERRSAMFTKANVSYTLSGGKQGTIEIERPHPRVDPRQSSTIDVDAGVVGSKEVAETYGLYVLALTQAQSRASGSVDLPANVFGADGSIRASHMLRPGLDRLRIAGMDSDSILLADPPQRVDSFRISRIAVEESDDRLTTTVELDQGADLIEVLQARFSKSDPSGVLAA